MRALWYLVVNVTEPTRTSHSDAVVSFKTQQGPRGWRIKAAQGAFYNDAFGACFRQLCNEQIMVATGMSPLGIHKAADISEKDAVDICETYFEFALAMVGLFVQTYMKHTHAPP